MKIIFFIITPLWILLDSAMHCNTIRPVKNNNSVAPKREIAKPITQNTPSNKVLISRYLNTFNTEGFYFHQESENEDLYIYYLQELSAKALRFPGGTLSNYYHHTLPGYGIKQEDVDKTNGDFISKAAQKHIKKQAQVLQQHPTNQNYLTSFLPLSASSNTSIILTLNLFSSELPELKAYLEKLKRESANISHIELGNEYFFKAYDATFPTVSSYIQKSKEVAAIARAIFPKAHIGVSVVDILTIDFESVKPHNQRLKEWNKALVNESFYNAIVVHNYSKTKTCSDQANSENLFCIFQENNKHIYQEFPRSMAYYQENFKGKQIWITEWNTSRLFEVTCNTFLQAFYYTEYMFQMMHYPEITLASYHNLLAGGCGYNLIKQSKKELSTSITYEAAKLLKPLFQDSTYLLLKEYKQAFLENNIVIQAFENQKDMYIYVLNKSDKSQTISMQDLSVSSSATRIEIQALLAKDLSSTMGSNNFPQASQGQVQKIDQASVLNFLPWSITRIKTQK